MCTWCVGVYDVVCVTWCVGVHDEVCITCSLLTSDWLERNLSRLDLGLAVDVVGLLQHVLQTASGDCSTPPEGGDRHVTADHFKLYLKDRVRPLYLHLDFHFCLPICFSVRWSVCLSICLGQFRCSRVFLWQFSDSLCRLLL